MDNNIIWKNHTKYNFQKLINFHCIKHYCTIYVGMDNSELKCKCLGILGRIPGLPL